MWELYDAILSGVQSEDRIKTVHTGPSWVMVSTEQGKIGVAAVQYGRSGRPVQAERYVGLPVTDAARLVKSWDFEEAALGLAAINTCLNRAERFPDCGEPDAFLRYRGRAEGKKVAVIGRFAYLEERLKPICDLYVLERTPNAEEYPDPACEYILPEMDLVFITGCTTSNKTLPRLLQLTQNAYTIITGPSTPMSEALFEFGADALCGFCTTDEEKGIRAVREGQGIFASGKMVCLERDGEN